MKLPFNLSERGLGFICGFAASGAMSMFQQDSLGLERYIEMVRTGWVEIHPAVGAGLFLFAIGCALFIPRGDS